MADNTNPDQQPESNQRTNANPPPFIHQEHKTFAEADQNIRILWKDRKRILGMPISFTRYVVDDERLTIRIGLFNTRTKDILLYRILDIKMIQRFGQKIFGVGTITLYTAEQSDNEVRLINIRYPEKVRLYIGELVEAERNERRLVGRELFGVAGEVMESMGGIDHEGIPH
jgi:hypothetical protein